MSDFTDLDRKAVNAIRVLAAELPNAANSGHPGAPMGMAPMAHVLFSRHMRYDPADPFWVSRDRFVLSNGHACALLYTMLHLTGYKQFPLAALKAFRQLDSITPGHPENHHATHGRVGGVEVTTGPLGQGISNAVGLALAEAHLAAVHGPALVDSFTYVFCGDGCLQEGVSGEASSLAGHLALGKLIVLYDDNNITIDGDTNLSFTEDVGKRYEAYGWQVLRVADGDSDLGAIDRAIADAKADSARPSLICIKTTIGVESDKAGTNKAHGSPLGWDETDRLRKKWGLPAEHHAVPDDVAQYYKQIAAKRAEAAAAWRKLEQDAAFKARLAGKLPAGWKDGVPTWTADDKADATRKLGGAVLEKLVGPLQALIGGSADLTGSNLTRTTADVDFQKDSRKGRYLRFGVREHGMAAICNGIAAFHDGALIPHCATFLNFVQYLLPALRLSALSHLGVIYVMTHDSIGLGEDGPTHQPINAAAVVRSTPNALFWRPADGNECSAAWINAVEERHRPSVLALSRQGTPQLAGSSIEHALKGAYTLVSNEKPSIVLVGTGTEVALALEAAKQLDNANVVSMPCWEIFEEQPQAYRLTVFPPGVPVVAIEALSTFGWNKYAHYTIGMTTFGASAPAGDVYKKFGITSENLVAKAKALLEKLGGQPAPPTHIEL